MCFLFTYTELEGGFRSRVTFSISPSYHDIEQIQYDLILILTHVFNTPTWVEEFDGYENTSNAVAYANECIYEKNSSIGQEHTEQ